MYDCLNFIPLVNRKTLLWSDYNKSNKTENLNSLKLWTAMNYIETHISQSSSFGTLLPSKALLKILVSTYFLKNEQTIDITAKHEISAAQNIYSKIDPVM